MRHLDTQKNLEKLNQTKIDSGILHQYLAGRWQINTVIPWPFRDPAQIRMDQSKSTEEGEGIFT